VSTPESDRKFQAFIGASRSPDDGTTPPSLDEAIKNAYDRASEYYRGEGSSYYDSKVGIQLEILKIYALGNNPYTECQVVLGTG